MPRTDSNGDFRNVWLGAYAMLAGGAALILVVGGMMIYSMSVIDVQPDQVAILTRLTGKDLPNDEEVAPDESYKGIQKVALPPGRHIRNPWDWEWQIEPQVVIPAGKVGVKVRLFGDDLPPGEFLATKPNEKGILVDVLQGRQIINPHTERLEIHEPIIVPAGFQGVVTNLSGPLAKADEDFDHVPNDLLSKRLLVKPKFRGVLRQTLNEGMYFINPYVQSVELIDCRSQRFNIGEKGQMGFPSKDGFWVSLDGVVEFRVDPKYAAQVYVLYNESTKTTGDDSVDEEIVRKIILPTARSFCRLEGSNSLGRDFIEGLGRESFQEKFQESMRKECEPLGVDVIQALITEIRPPQQIALPVRERELAKQKEKQYQQQILQQASEQQLAIEKMMVEQKKALVEAEQEIVRVTTTALQEQEVAKTKGAEKLAVAKLNLEAAQDEALAIETRGKAEAELVKFQNQAEAAGWKSAVEAFSGDGALYAQFVLYEKLAKSYRSMMINTADSPIMKIFESFQTPAAGRPAPSPTTPITSNSTAETAP